MALIKQDPLAPTIDANSYLTLAEWRARADELGVTLPVDDTEAESQILSGMTYIDTSNFIGETVIPFQGTAWPRAGVEIYHAGELVEYDNTVIPQQVIDAVLHVANESGVYLSVDPSKRVKRKKVDVIETEYDYGSSSGAQGIKKVSRADSLISMFVSSNQISNMLNVV